MHQLLDMIKNQDHRLRHWNLSWGPSIFSRFPNLNEYARSNFHPAKSSKDIQRWGQISDLIALSDFLGRSIFVYNLNDDDPAKIGVYTYRPLKEPSFVI